MFSEPQLSQTRKPQVLNKQRWETISPQMGVYKTWLMTVKSHSLHLTLSPFFPRQGMCPPQLSCSTNESPIPHDYSASNFAQTSHPSAWSSPKVTKPLGCEPNALTLGGRGQLDQETRGMERVSTLQAWPVSAQWMPSQWQQGTVAWQGKKKICELCFSIHGIEQTEDGGRNGT